ncbi:hypothetical protein ABIA33_002226 [Streptacidiphilus sp. MAP12-16]|uniref:hypothetical protein n=1 Tax=Streptacidiphilus sp. MAP12-16 TaxID=3156300 RepID=UPI003519569F
MMRSTSRTTTPRVLAAAGLLASGALLLTGCSSGSTAPAAGAAASAGASGSSQFTQYSDCLKSHGVTLPSGRPGGRPSGAARPSGRPSGGAGGFGGASANPSQAAAMQACASLRPQGQGGFGGGGGAGTTASAAFISCMKDNGVTVTPQQVRGISTSTDSKTVAALKVCKALLPTGGPGTAPTATPSS